MFKLQKHVLLTFHIWLFHTNIRVTLVGVLFNMSEAKQTSCKPHSKNKLCGHTYLSRVLRLIASQGPGKLFNFLLQELVQFLTVRTCLHRKRTEIWVQEL